MNKITCICLGVKDMERSIKFYRDGLGYKTDCRENNPPVCFFDTPGTKFELFPLEQLAKDIDGNNPPKGNGFSGITLAYNVEHKEDVDSVIELVRSAGGIIVKEPQDTFWGGYHAYFSDLDGYYWEVAWGFRVIIMTQANSQVNTRVLELLPKFKIKKMNRWCAV